MSDNPVPARLQRSRQSAELNKSPNGLEVVYVGRPSKWGNPFIPVLEEGVWWVRFGKRAPSHLASKDKKWAISLCVGEHYKLMQQVPKNLTSPLRGKNLQCWCKLCDRHKLSGKPWNETCPDCEECHADTLLHIANSTD